MSPSRNLLLFAALNGAMAVLVGAFAAHGAGPGVKALLTTGAQYQMVHAVLAVVCAIWPGQSSLVSLAGWLAALGGLVFCLSLSLIALLSLGAMGIVAPVGGLLMIAAWLSLAFAAVRTSTASA